MCFTWLLATLPFSLFAQSDNHPNRAYIGPNVFYRNYTEKLTLPLKSHDYGAFYGFEMGYEYKKSNMVYGNLAFSYAWGNVVYDGSETDLVTFEVTPFKGRSKNRILDTELEIGYTFAPKTLMSLNLTPYVGFGYFHWNRDVEVKEIYSWEFFSLGFLTTYDFNSYFNLGINIKSMKMLNGQVEFSLDDFSIDLNLGNRWQYGIELPLAFSFTKEKTYDLRFVPYYYQQNIGASHSKLVRLETNNKILTIEEPSSRH